MIMEMLAARVAAQIPKLTGVRPLMTVRKDAYPNATYETLENQNLAGLNCTTNVYQGVGQFIIAGRSYDEVTEIAEAMKEALKGWTATGTHYRIRRVRFVGEDDTVEGKDGTTTIFVKSLDFSFRASKLPTA